MLPDRRGGPTPTRRAGAKPESESAPPRRGRRSAGANRRGGWFVAAGDRIGIRVRGGGAGARVLRWVEVEWRRRVPQRHGVVFAGAGAAGEPKAILKALGSGKLLIEGSLSFKRAQAALQVETEISIRGAAAALATEPAGAPLPREVARARFADLPDSPATQSPKHEAAALMLQKVYKSFRTCRQLADCAVLVDQSWWKLLDFALLKRSSVSLDIEKQETAVSKWSRARTRAAKVGKGLLKDDKAQKLALQHWLEAIDP